MYSDTELVQDVIEAKSREEVVLPHEATIIIQALMIRDLCKANEYMSEEKATAQHLGMVSSAHSEDEVEKEKALLVLGQALFAQGWRIHYQPRNTHWQFAVPNEALIWRVVPAGYIATSEARRLQYVTRKS